ncbi:hypothetical protein ACFSUS_11185 [Spirosoma soli]|uniref:Uncharacterized protein n=1 Tax=Spirosoma soli TaxID=1770529 RepID=A0ABW5M4F8_9BACT
MNVLKVFDYVTPLVLLAVAGVYMIGDGLVHMGRQNNELQFIFGIPLTVFAGGLDFVIRRVVNRNTLYVWLIEAVFVGIVWSGARHF